MRALPSFALAILPGAIALPALAGPDLDVVYGDDMAHRGELATELAARWSQTSRASDFGGRTLWQAVGELAYGVSDNFNVGIKVPVTRSWHGHGAYVELKYLAPRGADGFYWGGELEAGSIKPVGEERAFVLEAIPILGVRIGRWHFVANPGVEYKLSYSLNDRHALGLEYHVEAGKFGDFAPRSKRSEMAYLTWDTRIHGHQLNVALGRGATHASDRWAMRIGIELDD
jgi:hypothetical protein